MDIFSTFIITSILLIFFWVLMRKNKKTFAMLDTPDKIAVITLFVFWLGSLAMLLFVFSAWGG